MAVTLLAGQALAWEPTRSVEFVVPAGTGGGADQMARLIAGIADKHRAVAEADHRRQQVRRRGRRGLPLRQGEERRRADDHRHAVEPVHYPAPHPRPLQPEESHADRAAGLDEFILWVNAEGPYKTAKDYLAAVKDKAAQADPEKKPELRLEMRGTGSAQEDQILTIQLEQATSVKFTYVPIKGGGELCVTLVGKHVDSTLNNPIECASHWKAGRVRPLAVFDYPLAPLVLTLVLGDPAENALRQSLIMSQGSLSILLTRPIAGVISAVAIFCFALPIVTPYWRRWRRAAGPER